MLAELFAVDGPISAELPGYRPRPGQIQLAEAVAEAMAAQQDLVAEAATGTGKTLAYLLPALCHNERVIISTGTLNLQDQLYGKDLPLALRVLGVQRKTALLKGRANYLCLHRLEQSEHSDGLADEVLRDHHQQIKSWARHTRSGDRSELASISPEAPIWPLVTSTQDNCLGSECPRYGDCHLVKARRQAQEADVVVVNHHLLFADLALKQTGFGEVLPGAGTVIIDEAHQVPETAMRFFSDSVSVWQLRELGRDALSACAAASGALAVLQAPLMALRSALDQATAACVDLPSRGSHELMATAHLELQALAKALEALHQALLPLADQSRDLAQCEHRAQSLRQSLHAFLQGRDGHVRWFVCRQGRFALHLTPLNVAEPLSRLREQVPATWIMVSATLAVAGQFQHFTRRIGIEPAHELVIDSPFDYPKQARLWLPEGLPEPGSEGHTEALLNATLPLLQASQGRAFLLFTTHRALRQAAVWLRTHSDLNVLVQEEAPRGPLLEAFRNTPHSVLLGAASFWEGVDVPGDDLQVVVIDKLPFAAPDDPVLEATLLAARDAGENPFMSVQLPQAVLALKQGAGRLIRQHEDVGVLVLGDPRLQTKPYGRLFLASLPKMTRVSNRTEACDFLRHRSAA